MQRLIHSLFESRFRLVIFLFLMVGWETNWQIYLGSKLPQGHVDFNKLGIYIYIYAPA